eukprot:gnl/TRDRNA2_/TRDRNA2_120925_c0_seq1.p1 gnl/TRDRNA2_/TRDRNA2_120925_c0~~gnl/TRDRNA2_/TRDRNA2_120925_c0_seq1.p1  ORF type:complete len:109 (+),score=19.00 gnl/TRDRNA2_/TRDRNA2_120925_c0_seq1:290-616(+)
MLKKPDGELFTQLARAAERRVSDFRPQNFANLAWAYSTMFNSEADRREAPNGSCCGGKAAGERVQHAELCVPPPPHEQTRRRLLRKQPVPVGLMDVPGDSCEALLPPV